MYKVALKICVMIISLVLVTTLFAQSFFGGGGNNNSKKAAPASPVPTPAHVMSAEEFSNKVNSLNQKTRSSVSQELKQTLTAPPPPAPPKMPPPTTPKSEQTPLSATPTAAQPLPNVNETQPAAPAYVPPPPVDNGTSNATQSLQSVVPPQPETPAQSQTYTGFGTQNTGGQNKNNSSGSSSGGWGVKY